MLISKEKRKESALKAQESISQNKQNKVMFPKSLNDELLHIILNEITPEQILRFGYVLNDNGNFTTRTFKNKEELTKQKLKRTCNDKQLYQIIKGYYGKIFQDNHICEKKNSGMRCNKNNCFQFRF